MRILLQKHTFMYVIMAGIFCAIVAMVGITLATHAQAASNEPVAAGKHLITLHDNGQDRGILTSASTLRAAFKEAKVAIDPNDLVEPGLDDTLVASQYEVNIYRARPITIVDGAVRQKVLSPYQTARQVAAHAGITLHDEDTTTLLANSNVVTEGAGLQLTVTRATPFTLVLYGKSVQAYTQAKTVGEMMKQKSITLQPADTLSVAASTPIAANMTVELWRNGKQVITEDQAIAFPIDQTKDADQPVGYKKVTTPGVDGKKTVSYEVEMKNGVEMSRTEIQSVTTLEPVRQAEVIGVKGKYTTPSENEVIIWNFLIGQGFTRIQTAGIMGNLQQEHGFRTTGDGLAQWTGARKANLMRLPNYDTVTVQIQFMMDELNGGYASTLSRIRSADTIEAAVQAFQNGYEKCGVCNEDGRIQFARNILASH